MLVCRCVCKRKRKPCVCAHVQIRRLPLQRLGLSGVKLGDKGAAALAEGLRANSSLLELDLQRCGLTDVGGSLLFEVRGGGAGGGVRWGFARMFGKAAQGGCRYQPKLKQAQCSRARGVCARAQ